MGAIHWARHAKKPEPVIQRDIGDNLRLVVRERPHAIEGSRLRFVASIVRKNPEKKGNYVVIFLYGKTAHEAELNVMRAFRSGREAGEW